jgi:deoxyribonuclease V
VAWPASAQELIEAQSTLAAGHAEPWAPPEVPAVGGCFVCFERGLAGAGAPGDRGWAGAAVFRAGLVLATAAVEGTAGGAYQPGLLALREGPLLEAVVRALGARPDVLIVNATGRDHPRQAGLALHLGAALNVPTVGVTDRPLLDEGAARWVETRPGARPVLVHAGWRTDLHTAVDLVVAATRRARTPEPLRRAREVARRSRSQASK